MKRTILMLVGAAIMALSLISCATLQQDVYTYSADNIYIYNSIGIYERQFISIDEKIHSGPAASQSSNQSSAADISTLLSDISSYRNSTKVSEPFLLARLRAFEGLLALMSGDSVKANSAYKDAKSLQKNDPYVQLLGNRLINNPEGQLASIEGLLAKDTKNAVLTLEKGKLLFAEGKYHEAVAAMDNAFILFDKEGLKDYREIYSPLRANAWELYSVSGLKVSKSGVNAKTDLGAVLSRDNLISLTLSNSSLFANKKAVENFLTRLEITEPEITRKSCARFIWNLYAQKTGNQKNLTKYSQKYKASGRTKSPVADVAVDDRDFDAVLGVVENEFMELPDGRNFQPDSSLTNMEFLNILKKADK